jgi:hypothetical protein
MAFLRQIYEKPDKKTLWKKLRRHIDERNYSRMEEICSLFFAIFSKSLSRRTIQVSILFRQFSHQLVPKA